MLHLSELKGMSQISFGVLYWLLLVGFQIPQIEREIGVHSAHKIELLPEMAGCARTNIERVDIGRSGCALKPQMAVQIVFTKERRQAVELLINVF